MTFLYFQIESVHWTFEKLDQSGDSGELQHLSEFLAEKNIELVINLPMRNGERRVSSFVTHGYKTRRMAVDLTIPLITDVIKNIKTFYVIFQPFTQYRCIRIRNSLLLCVILAVYELFNFGESSMKFDILV